MCTLNLSAPDFEKNCCTFAVSAANLVGRGGSTDVDPTSALGSGHRCIVKAVATPFSLSPLYHRLHLEHRMASRIG